MIRSRYTDHGRLRQVSENYTGRKEGRNEHFFSFCPFTMEKNEKKYSYSQRDPSEKLRHALNDNNLVEVGNV